jgi:hypothetical protein
LLPYSAEKFRTKILRNHFGQEKLELRLADLRLKKVMPYFRGVGPEQEKNTPG